MSKKYIDGLISQGGNKDKPPEVVFPWGRLFDDLKVLKAMIEEETSNNFFFDTHKNGRSSTRQCLWSSFRKHHVAGRK